MSEEQEIIVIGLFPPNVVKWLQKKFKDVQYIRCVDTPELCKQVREKISDVSREEIEHMYYTY